MKYRMALVIFVAMSASVPAKAERQIYNPYALGVTQQELDRDQAMKERQAIMGGGNQTTSNARTNRKISPIEQYQVLSIEEKFKSRFPVHPGLYKDAYDRGTFRRSTGGGNNPLD